MKRLLYPAKFRFRYNRALLFLLVAIGAGCGSRALAQPIAVNIVVAVPVKPNATSACPATAETGSGVISDGYEAYFNGNKNPVLPDGIHQGIPTGGFTSVRSHLVLSVTTPQDYAVAHNVLALSSTIFYDTFNNNHPLKVANYCWLNAEISVANLESDEGFDLASDTSPIPYTVDTCRSIKRVVTCTITIPATPDWTKITNPGAAFRAQASLYTQADEVLALSERIYQNSLSPQQNGKHAANKSK
jgi:hypothetical protein